MRCEFFSNAGGFLGCGGDFLVENEAENTVLLGHARRCMHRPRKRCGDGGGARRRYRPPGRHDDAAARPGPVGARPRGHPTSRRSIARGRHRTAGRGRDRADGGGFAALWRRRIAGGRGRDRTILYRRSASSRRERPRRAAPGSDVDLEWLAAGSAASPAGEPERRRTCGRHARGRGGAHRTRRDVPVGRRRAAGRERRLHPDHARRRCRPHQRRVHARGGAR